MYSRCSIHLAPEYAPIFVPEANSFPRASFEGQIMPKDD